MHKKESVGRINIFMQICSYIDAPLSLTTKNCTVPTEAKELDRYRTTKTSGVKFHSVRVTTNFAKPLVQHVFSRFEVDIYRVTTAFPRPCR